LTGYRHRRSGQVIVVVLVAMTLLAGLVFYVYNVGDQVNRRLALQNAADAAAISGAGWMARSMNLIAMDNVAMARLLAIVPVLDSLPLAVEMSLAEIPDWEESLKDLQRRIGAGAPAELTSDERAILDEAITTLLRPYGAPADSQYDKSDILEGIRQTLSDAQMQQYTHWRLDGQSGPAPHGKIWQAFMALYNFSRSTVGSAGALAQHNAVRLARANGAAGGMMLPAVPAIPAKLGRFEDFKPVLIGRIRASQDGSLTYVPEVPVWTRSSTRIGGAIPDWAEPHRLGPWAKLYGWWIPLRYWVSTSPAGSGNVSMGGRSSGSNAMSSGYWVDVVPPVYHTYGPYSWALRSANCPQLHGTEFHSYIKRLADIKLGYMFNPPDRLETILFPEWITDYDQAAAIAASEPGRIKRSRYYRVRIVSSVPRGSPNWLGQTTYTDPDTGQQVTVNTFRTNASDPEVFVPSGWVDLEGGKAERLSGMAIWQDEWTASWWGPYPELGLPGKYDDQGRTVEQHIYIVDWWIFAGADVGEDRTVDNPCNWDDPDQLPGPILLDTDQGDYDPHSPSPDDGYRRRWFTYLGLAGRSARARVWPSRFSSALPDGRMVAMAQARVFNNTSWDLWTQDWQAKLVPVTKLDAWRNALAEAPAEALLVDGRAVDLESYSRFLEALNPQLVDKYLNH